MRALVIPVTGPLEEIALVGGEDGGLEQMQRLVGGYVEALALPSFIPGNEQAAAYINGEGKFLDACDPNRRATDFLVPGVGLFFGDYIAGPLVLCGFDPASGEHAGLPAGVAERAYLIEREAA